jgi:hypothetical protein
MLAMIEGRRYNILIFAVALRCKVYYCFKSTHALYHLAGLISTSIGKIMAPRKKKETAAPAKGKKSGSSGPKKAAGVRKATAAQPSRRQPARTVKGKSPADRTPETQDPAEEETSEADAQAPAMPAADPTPAEGSAGGSAAGPATVDTAEEIATDEYRDAEPLAEVRSDFTVTLRGEDAESNIRVRLIVHADPNTATNRGISNRLGYHAQFFLIRGDTEAANADVEQIGYLNSWRINKPTPDTLHPESRTGWTADFLRPSRKSETALCLRALYTGAGVVRDEVGNALGGEAARTALNGSLMFIETIYIFRAFQNKGLLGHILNAYVELLLQLPEWYVFNGAFVLVPARPDGVQGASWGTTSDDAVEATLIAVYGRHGFQIWRRDAKIGGAIKGVYVTVMGKS